MSAAEGIETRQIFDKWHAYCGCGGYWSGPQDTEAEAVAWIEHAIATGNCQCARAAAVAPRETKD